MKAFLKKEVNFCFFLFLKSGGDVVSRGIRESKETA